MTGHKHIVGYVWMLVAFLLMVYLHNETYKDLKLAEEMAKERTGLVATCMDGGAISWYDPTTDAHKLTVCDTHDVPVMR